MTCVVEIEPTNERRGMRGCPTCHRRALKLVETETHDVPADRGAIMATRTFVCTTIGCEMTLRTLELCQGFVTKKSVRGDGVRYDADAKKTVRDDLDPRGKPSSVAVDVGPDRIVVKT